MPDSVTPQREFESSHGRVAWGVSGDGPPVVLVHGTPANSVIWSGIVERLQSRYRCYFLDLPGYGRSAQYAGQEVRLRSFARAVAEFVDHIGAARPHLVGHDFGAAAVMGAHLIEGQDATSLTIADGVVLSPWGTPFSQHVRDHEEVFAAVPEYIHVATLRAHLATAVARSLPASIEEALLAPWRGPEGQRAYYRQVGQYDYEYTQWLEKRYPDVTVPVTVLWGEQDQWVTPSEGRRFHELLPNAQMRMLPDAGHFSMVDTPGLFARELEATLDAQVEAT